MAKKPDNTLSDKVLKNLAHAAGILDFRTITNLHTQATAHTDKMTLEVTVSINVSQKELAGMLK